jgi:hypothetical protein
MGRRAGVRHLPQGIGERTGRGAAAGQEPLYQSAIPDLDRGGGERFVFCGRGDGDPVGGAEAGLEGEGAAQCRPSPRVEELIAAHARSQQNLLKIENGCGEPSSCDENAIWLI